MKNILKQMVLAAVLGTGLGAIGCAYAGIAVAPNGTVYVAKNNSLLFGMLNQVYACTASGTTLACVPAAAP